MAIAVRHGLGDAACTVPWHDRSDTGEFGWSLMPPGPECTYVHLDTGAKVVEGPGWAMSAWIGASIVCSGIVWQTRSWRR